MRKFLKIIGSISLATSIVTTTAIVVSCSDNKIRVNQPTSWLNALGWSNTHILRANEILKNIGLSMPKFKSSLEQSNWERNSSQFQEYIIEFAWGYAYSIKGYWFFTKITPYDNFDQFKIVIDDLKDNSASNNTKKILDQIFEWTKVQVVFPEHGI